MIQLKHVDCELFQITVFNLSEYLSFWCNVIVNQMFFYQILGGTSPSD
jgi:hypothetical protein